MKEGQVSPLLTALILQKGKCSFYSQSGIVDFLSPRVVYFSRVALERSQVVSEQLRLTVREAHTVVTYLPHHERGACPALRTENPRLHEALGLAPGLIGTTHGRVENGLCVCLNLFSQFLGTEGRLHQARQRNAGFGRGSFSSTLWPQLTVRLRSSHSISLGLVSFISKRRMRMPAFQGFVLESL